MLENEVDYRLAKMLLGCLYHDGLLTENRCRRSGINYWNTTTRRLSRLRSKEIGDGVTVSER